MDRASSRWHHCAIRTSWPPRSRSRSGRTCRSPNRPRRCCGAAALAARRDLADDATALQGRAEELLDARVRYASEQKAFRHITEHYIERLRAAQPLRWSLGMERGRSMTFDELIDLALSACDAALAGR
jgi:hypothetical protein